MQVQEAILRRQPAETSDCESRSLHSIWTELLQGLLTIDPTARMTASQALQLPVFASRDQPTRSSRQCKRQHTKTNRGETLTHSSLCHFENENVIPAQPFLATHSRSNSAHHELAHVNSAPARLGCTALDALIDAKGIYINHPLSPCQQVSGKPDPTVHTSAGSASPSADQKLSYQSQSSPDSASTKCAVADSTSKRPSARSMPSFSSADRLPSFCSAGRLPSSSSDAEMYKMFSDLHASLNSAAFSPTPAATAISVSLKTAEGKRRSH